MIETFRRGLAPKFLLLIGLVVAGVTAAVVYFALNVYRDSMYRQLLTRAFNNLENINTRLQNSLWTKTGRLKGVRERSISAELPPELVYRVEKIFDDLLRSDDAVRYFVLHYPGGTLIYPGIPGPKKGRLKADRNSVRDVEKVDARYNRETGYVETFIAIPDRENNAWAHIEMGLSTAAVESGILRTVVSSSIVALLCIGVALAVARHFLKNILGPVKRLQTAAASISSGDLAQRVPVTTTDEIADLGRSFNTMADSLDHRIQDLNAVQAFSKEMSAKLSREELLRTIVQTFAKISGAGQCAMLSLSKDKSHFFVSSGIGVVEEHAKLPPDGRVLSRLGNGVEDLHLAAPLEACPELEIFYPHGIPIPSAHGALVLPLRIRDRLDSVMLLLGENLNAGADDLRLYRTLLGHTVVSIQNARLYELAITDGLTGLFLRRHFLFELDRILESPPGVGLALVMLDIDHFKKVNDTYGHPEGDFILVSVAETLRQTLRTADIRRAARDPDILGRYGGEEFIALLRNVDRAGAQIAAEKMRRAIEDAAFAGEKHRHRITVSLGVCPYRPGLKPEEWISLADGALYASKSGGRNRVTVHE
ncbi:diguanylate cyclase [bacterium]|nr:diguanylate cyclase [bacterium]